MDQAHPTNDDTPLPGSAEAGRALLTAMEATPDAHADKIAAVVELIRANDDFALAYELWNRGTLRQLGLTLLRFLTEGGSRPVAADVIDEWPAFDALPRELVDSLLVDLAPEITELIVQDSLQTSRGTLYQRIPVTLELRRWLSAELAGTSASDWLDDFRRATRALRAVQRALHPRYRRIPNRDRCRPCCCPLAANRCIVRARGPLTILAVTLAAEEGEWALDVSIAGPIADYLSEVSDGLAMQLGQDDLLKLINRLPPPGQDNVTREVIRKLASDAPAFFQTIGTIVVDVLGRWRR